MDIIVSIIIPTYNYGHLISKTLGNITEQSFENWECIIIDDGSKDNTEQVVKSFLDKDSRFIYIKQKNEGPNAARNNGLAKAKGEFIQFLDADDKLQKDKLKYQVDYLKKHPKIEVLYGNALIFFNDKENEYIPAEMPRVSGTINEVGESFLKKCIMINTALTRKTVFDKVGYPSTQLKAAEDWEFWIRCLHKGCIFQYVELPNTNALVQKHENNATQQTWRQEYWIYRMRKTIQKYITINHLKILNQKLLQRDKEILPYLVIKLWQETNKINAQYKMWQTAQATQNFRHFCYAFLMPFLNVRTFEKIISYSFRRLFINGKKQ